MEICPGTHINTIWVLVIRLNSDTLKAKVCTRVCSRILAQMFASCLVASGTFVSRTSCLLYIEINHILFSLQLRRLYYLNSFVAMKE